ncbi:hypothetical protein AgCh_012802 [Apium graveolens]
MRPDHYTLTPLFKACGEVGDMTLGLSLHNWVIKCGYVNYVVVGSALLEFYLKCREAKDAKRVFDDLMFKDSVAWNSMISGLVRLGSYVDALVCFRDMLKEGMVMDRMAIPSILSACGREGDVMKGKEIHGQVVKSLRFCDDVTIVNALIDMYSKCGFLYNSENVFKNMISANLVSWTTMISCYGVHGKGKESLVLFEEMKVRGFEPNSVTITAILASCSHSGLVDQGKKIFDSLGLVYNIEPCLEHYACIIDLLGRSGLVEEAFELIKNMKLDPTASIWGALLAGCMMCRNVEIGEIAAHHLFDIEPKNTSNYIALCSIYESLVEIVLTLKNLGRNTSEVQEPDHSQALEPGDERETFQEQPLHTPVVERIVNTRDARTLIELNQYKYTNVPVAKEHMASLTSDELAEAIRLYRQEQTRLQEEAEVEEEPEESGVSQQSKRSVFDRIGAKGKKIKKDQSKKEVEAAKQRKLEEVREQIRKEEVAKLELKIQKRMQLEEKKLLAKSRSKRTWRDPTPELISDYEEEERQKDLKDMIYELQRKMDRDSGVEIGETLTPFSHSLEVIPRQRNLKHYNFDSFDGLGDPEEHLNYFEQIAQIYYYNDLTKSRFSASTLKGGAQRWFSRIPSRSIHSWKEYRASFLRRFRANKMHEMHMYHLETIRQHDNESLSAYMRRFQEANNKVSSLDEREALSILRRNLDPEHNERYIVELINKEPQSMAAAYSMAAKFIKETDVLQAMKMTRNGGSRSKNTDDRPKGGYHQDKKFKQSNQSQEKQTTPVFQILGPKQESNSDPGPAKQPREPKQEPDRTPLNMTREEILKEVKDKPFYYPPKPMQTPPERRPYNRQCDYHETHGHKTENCLSLKYFIEDQVKKGNMNKYLVRDNNRGEAQKRGKNVVNVVIGRSYSPPQSPHFGEEVLSIQSLQDLVISFSSKDYEGVNPHHNAALVVTLDIFDNEVRRILIDNGSLVNILFKHTVDRMQLGSVRSNKCRDDPLYGFGHNIVPIQGTLYLPVIFGTAPNQVTHVIKFYVINAPSSYNEIIDRSALTMMQAITSISHLKIKFPTPTGVGEIKGDYGVAEICYTQGLVMAETHQDNKRKATVLRKQQSMKKHRPRIREEATKEVQIIESDPEQERNVTSPEGPASNQVMVVDKANQVPDQASPTMQATKESEQANFYLKKNSEARIHQMVSNKEQAKIEAAVETEEV